MSHALSPAVSTVTKPRKCASFTVRLRRGSYKYICTVPGHAAATA